MNLARQLVDPPGQGTVVAGGNPDSRVGVSDIDPLGALSDLPVGSCNECQQGSYDRPERCDHMLAMEELRIGVSVSRQRLVFSDSRGYGHDPLCLVRASPTPFPTQVLSSLEVVDHRRVPRHRHKHVGAVFVRRWVPQPLRGLIALDRAPG